MYVNVLRAIKRGLCQADEDEILVPNPSVTRHLDNDFFVGLTSRRPAQFGRVAVVEGWPASDIAAADQTGVLGNTPPETWDEERREEVLYFLDVLSKFDPGTLLACTYTWDGDEVTWDIYEVDPSELPA